VSTFGLSSVIKLGVFSTQERKQDRPRKRSRSSAYRYKGKLLCAKPWSNLQLSRGGIDLSRKCHAWKDCSYNWTELNSDRGKIDSGVARISPRRLGHPARAGCLFLGWVPKTLCVIFLSYSASIPSLPICLIQWSITWVFTPQEWKEEMGFTFLGIWRLDCWDLSARGWMPAHRYSPPKKESKTDPGHLKMTKSVRSNSRRASR